MIEGKNLYLRPATAEDMSNILRWRNAPQVARRFLIRTPITEQEHGRWLTEEIAKGRAVQFIITLKENGREIGSQYFQNIDREQGRGEFGIFIGEEDALGRGYGSEALALSLPYAHETLALPIVYLKVLAGNVRAVRAYEHAGFVRIPERDLELVIEERPEKIYYMEHRI